MNSSKYEKAQVLLLLVLLQLAKQSIGHDYMAWLTEPLHLNYILKWKKYELFQLQTTQFAMHIMYMVKLVYSSLQAQAVQGSRCTHNQCSYT